MSSMSTLDTNSSVASLRSRFKKTSCVTCAGSALVSTRYCKQSSTLHRARNVNASRSYPMQHSSVFISAASFARPRRRRVSCILSSSDRDTAPPFSESSSAVVAVAGIAGDKIAAVSLLTLLVLLFSGFFSARGNNAGTDAAFGTAWRGATLFSLGAWSGLHIACALFTTRFLLPSPGERFPACFDDSRGLFSDRSHDLFRQRFPTSALRTPVFDGVIIAARTVFAGRTGVPVCLRVARGRRGRAGEKGAARVAMTESL